MTESQWFIEVDFLQHLRCVESQLSPRKLRLLAAGFCRTRGVGENAALLAAVDAVERYADGVSSPAQIESARGESRRVAIRAYEEHVRWAEGGSRGVGPMVRPQVAWAVAFAASTPLPLDRLAELLIDFNTPINPNFERFPSRPHLRTSDPPLLGIDLRPVIWDVAGNPFARVWFDPSWLTSTAIGVARQIYQSGDFSAMPILADALQDADCDNDDILNHCRDPQAAHVRGCWVVDGLLGKS
jgi:hypothetical protein